MDDAAITRQALAARHGDQDAAAAFIQATSAQLHRTLRYLARDAETDDLVQETYLRAFAALPRYAAQAPARLWLLAIARRVAADHVRQQQRRPRRAATPEWERELETSRPVPDPASLVAFRQAIEALSPDRREAFVLTCVAGLSYAETADICGCPVGTIRSRVFRARNDLIEALGSHDIPISGLGS